MFKTYLATALACSLSSSIFAGDMGTQVMDTRSWSVIGSLGYTAYENSYGGNGQTAVGRFAIGKHLVNLGSTRLATHLFNGLDSNLGLEVGVQNGNRMPVKISTANLDLLGGLPIWTTVQPMLDALITLKTGPNTNNSVFGVVKGGIAYRRWQMDRDTVNNLSQVAGEVQAGFGLPITQMATLSLLYQGVYGGNPNFKVNSVALTGHVSNIPIQNGVLLSLGMTL